MEILSNVRQVTAALVRPEELYLSVTAAQLVLLGVQVTVCALVIRKRRLEKSYRVVLVVLTFSYARFLVAEAQVVHALALGTLVVLLASVLVAELHEALRWSRRGSTSLGLALATLPLIGIAVPRFMGPQESVGVFILIDALLVGSFLAHRVVDSVMDGMVALVLAVACGVVVNSKISSSLLAAVDLGSADGLRVLGALVVVLDTCISVSWVLVASIVVVRQLWLCRQR